MPAIDFLARGATAIGLLDEAALIEALGTLAKNWSVISNQPDVPPSILDFLRRLVALPTDPAVVATLAVMDHFHLDQEKSFLQQNLSKYAGKLDDFQKKFGPLLAPVGSATGIASIKLPQIAEGTSAGRLTLQIDADATLEVEGAAAWRFSDADMQKGPFIRLGFDGTVKGAAGVKVPFDFGSVSANASGQGEMKLEYYFTPDDPNELLALAVVGRLPNIPNPFDFDAIARAIANDGLTGLVMQPSGKAMFTLGVVLGADFEIIKGIQATVGLTIDVDVTISGDYSLSLRRVATAAGHAPDILAVLSRNRMDPRTLSTGLTADVDFSGLLSRVHKIIQDYVNWTNDAFLSKITPYLTPGTWLRQKASALVQEKIDTIVADGGFQTAIDADVGAFFGITKSGGNVAKWLTTEMTTAIDKVGNVLTADRDAAVTAITGLLGDRFSALGGEAVKNRITGPLTALLDEVVGQFEDQAKTLIGDATQPINDLLKKLGGEVATAGAAADNALANVRQLVKIYQDAVQKLLDETGNAVNAHVKLTLATEESQWDGKGYQIVGTFRPGESSAAETYGALLHGDMTAMTRLLTEPVPGFTIDRSQSRITTTVGGSDKTAVDFVLFGIDASETLLLKGETVTVLDGAGNIQIASRGDFERDANGVRESMRLTFFDIWSIVANKALADANLPPVAKAQVGFGLTYDDSDLKRSEVEKFFGSLQSAKLLTDAAAATAESVIADWYRAGGNSKLAVSFAATLGLSVSQIALLLKQAQSCGSTGTVADRIAAFGRAMDALRLFGVMSKKLLDIAVQIAGKEYGNDHIPASDAACYAMLFEFTDRLGKTQRDEDETVLQWGDPSYGFDGGDIHEVFGVIRLADGFVRFIAKLDDIQRAGTTWNAAQYRQAQLDLVSTLTGWLTVNRILIFGLDARVSARTRAFFSAFLATVSAPVGGSALMLKMARKNDGAPDTVVAIG